MNTSTKSVVDVRKEGLDKFYTEPRYAKRCIEKVWELYEKSEVGLVVEPSAGNGSFFSQMEHPNVIGIDIAPEDSNIIEMDFFDYTPEALREGKIMVVGNPPFGKVSSVAIKFFNHSAEWADIIAFIIPRTFRRPSVQNKLDARFHLVYDDDTPTKPCSFHPPMSAKCCFQIWERRPDRRPLVELPTKHEHWDFMAFGPLDVNGQPTPPKGANFAMRAYGGKVGEIKKEGLDELRPKSWHWIRSKIPTEQLINTFTELDYSGSSNTARQNSMGRGELVRLYDDFINSKLK